MCTEVHCGGWVGARMGVMVELGTDGGACAVLSLSVRCVYLLMRWSLYAICRCTWSKGRYICRGCQSCLRSDTELRTRETREVSEDSPRPGILNPVRVFYH